MSFKDEYADGKDDGLPPVSLDDGDMAELKEIILEFLSKYDALYHKRVQKLVFYGEVFTAQKAGERLTRATYVPFLYGPYSKAVEQALDELYDEGKVTKADNGQYVTEVGGGDLSNKKQYLIDRIHSETKNKTTDELVEMSKDTWLWQEFDQAEEMDFATYIDEVLISPRMRARIADGMEKNEVPEPDIERLLTG